MMQELDLDKLHVTMMPGLSPVGVTSPRRYTFTQYPLRQELHVSIGPDFDHKLLSGWGQRWVWGGVTAAWQYNQDGWGLHVNLPEKGVTAVFPHWRDEYWRQRLPLILQSLRHADQRLFQALPQLEQSSVFVHFPARQAAERRTERWGKIGDYRRRREFSPMAAAHLRPVVDSA